MRAIKGVFGEENSILEDATVIDTGNKSSNSKELLIDKGFKSIIELDSGLNPEGDGSREFKIKLANSEFVQTVFVNNYN